MCWACVGVLPTIKGVAAFRAAAAAAARMIFVICAFLVGSCKSEKLEIRSKNSSRQLGYIGGDPTGLDRGVWPRSLATRVKRRGHEPEAHLAELLGPETAPVKCTLAHGQGEQPPRSTSSVF